MRESRLIPKWAGDRVICETTSVVEATSPTGEKTKTGKERKLGAVAAKAEKKIDAILSKDHSNRTVIEDNSEFEDAGSEGNVAKVIFDERDFGFKSTTDLRTCVDELKDKYVAAGWLSMYYDAENGELVLVKANDGKGYAIAKIEEDVFDAVDKVHGKITAIIKREIDKVFDKAKLPPEMRKMVAREIGKRRYMELGDDPQMASYIDGYDWQ